MDGKPLDGGYIYIGTAGFEARSTPKASFFDAALTVPTGTSTGAAVRTQAGYPVRNGSAAVIYVDGDHSMTITDAVGVVVFAALNRTFELGNPTSTVGPVVAPDGTLALPGFAFTADTDTGITRSATNTMQLVAGGLPMATLAAGSAYFHQPVQMAAPLAVAQGGTGLATFPATTIFGNSAGSPAAPAPIDAATALATIGAMPVATSPRLQYLSAGPSTPLNLPAGGSWGYWWNGQVLATGVLQFGGAGVAAGGSTLTSGAAGYQFVGWAWKTT